MVQEDTEHEQKQKPYIHKSFNYHRTQMQRGMIIEKLKEQGCRITKQRKILLDIILEEECSSCKEIFYRASRIDSKIGTATVYRMINTLEKIGAISRKNMYKIVCSSEGDIENTYIIELNDNTIYYLSEKKWNSIILAGLKTYGYAENQEIKKIMIQPDICE